LILNLTGASCEAVEASVTATDAGSVALYTFKIFQIKFSKITCFTLRSDINKDHANSCYYRK